MPKKKGKAKLSPEEALALAEQQALAAVEEKVRKTEMATKFLREKLEQEERNTRISVRKIDEQWRMILRKAKAEELRKEIQILSQTFERVVDRKDAIIKTLVVDLEEAERQEMMALQAHFSHTDGLIDFQQRLMDQLHAEFNAELEVYKTEFLSERDRIISAHEKELSDIKDIVFAMEMEHGDNEGEATQEFNSRRDEIRTKNLEAKESLKAELEKNVADLWDLFQQALRNYRHSTNDKQKEFETLRDRDRVNAQAIDVNMRKLNRLTERITACKAHLAQNQKDCDARNRQLKAEKEAVLGHFQKLKNQMNVSRSRERERLTKLTVASEEAIELLKKRKRAGEAILKAAEMARKLETEEEKVLPFYKDSVSQEELEEAMGAEALGPATPQANPGDDQSIATRPDGVAVNEYGALEGFQKRYNKVLLDNCAVQKEHDALTDENVRLRNILKQYLDGFAVTHEVLSQENTLMVVNGKTNAPIPRAVPVGDPRIHHVGPTVVDGNLTVQAKAMGRAMARA